MTKQIVMTGIFGTLRVEREVINVETMGGTKPDPNWRYTDKAGHSHYFSIAANGYPTLVMKLTSKWWCQDCHEHHEEWDWECPECHEQIEPRRVADPGPHYLPGIARYYLNDEEISSERYLELIAEVIK